MCLRYTALAERACGVQGCQAHALCCFPPNTPPGLAWTRHRLFHLTRGVYVCRVQGIGVSALPVVEMDGLIWVWPGDKSAMTAGPPASLCRAPEGFQVGARTSVAMRQPWGMPGAGVSADLECSKVVQSCRVAARPVLPLG